MRSNTASPVSSATGPDNRLPAGRRRDPTGDGRLRASATALTCVIFRRRHAIHRVNCSVYMGMQGFGLPVGRLPDEALLSGLATGDPELAVTFVRRFQHTVFGVAIAVL